MNRRSTLSPALLELILTILFFALATSVVVRLIAAANDISRSNELQSRALIAMENAVETAKSDPAAFGVFDDAGLCTVEIRADDDILLTVLVQREPTAAGALYVIEARAENGTATLGTLSGARYVHGEAIP